MITDELASRVGASTQFENIPVFVQTAGGVVDAYPSKLAQVAIGGAQVQDLPVLVCETMGNDVDGLLGANFLRRFQVAIDHESGKILFRNRDGRPVDPIELLYKPQTQLPDGITDK